MAIRIKGAPAAQFPVLTNDVAALLLVIGNQDPTAGPLEFEVTSNLAHGMGNQAAVIAIGYALHTVGAALLSGGGEVVDLTDLHQPIPDTPGGNS